MRLLMGTSTRSGYGVALPEILEIRIRPPTVFVCWAGSLSLLQEAVDRAVRKPNIDALLCRKLLELTCDEMIYQRLATKVFRTEAGFVRAFSDCMDRSRTPGFVCIANGRLSRLNPADSKISVVSLPETIAFLAA